MLAALVVDCDDSAGTLIWKDGPALPASSMRSYTWARRKSTSVAPWPFANGHNSFAADTVAISLVYFRTAIASELKRRKRHAGSAFAVVEHEATAQASRLSRGRWEEWRMQVPRVVRALARGRRGWTQTAKHNACGTGSASECVRAAPAACVPLGCVGGCDGAGGARGAGAQAAMRSASEGS